MKLVLPEWHVLWQRNDDRLLNAQLQKQGKTYQLRHQKTPYVSQVQRKWFKKINIGNFSVFSFLLIGKSQLFTAISKLHVQYFLSFFLPSPRTFSFASRLSIYNIYKQANFYMKLIQQFFWSNLSSFNGHSHKPAINCALYLETGYLPYLKCFGGIIYLDCLAFWNYLHHWVPRALFVISCVCINTVFRILSQLSDCLGVEF